MCREMGRLRRWDLEMVLRWGELDLGGGLAGVVVAVPRVDAAAVVLRLKEEETQKHPRLRSRRRLLRRENRCTVGRDQICRRWEGVCQQKYKAY